jgi:predicted DNA-binding transcriptional regulator YafY
VHPPEGVDLLAEVAASVERPPDRTATVRIRSGRAAGLRRTAMTEQDSGDAPGWDRVTLPLGSLWDTARRIAGHGPDVVVEEPADLVDATVHLLSGTRRTVTRRARQPAVEASDDLLKGLSG